jgi:hypothetical protein
VAQQAGNRPEGVRSKMNANIQATRATPDDDDARRKRKATTTAS